MTDDLYIPYYAADNGDRVNQQPCSDQQHRPWLSDSVLLADLNDAPLARARVGVDCHIRVKLSTRGRSFVQNPVNYPLRVQLWVSDFTLGVGPASNAQYTGSFPWDGQTITPAGNLDAVNPELWTSYTWRPQAGDLRNPNADGSYHMCIGANTYWADNPADGKPAGKDAAGNYEVLDICNNAHHGAHNISIVAAAGVGGLKISVPNDGPHATQFRLEAREATDRLSLSERWALLAQPYIGLARGDAPDDRPEFHTVAAEHGWDRIRDELGNGGEGRLLVGEGRLRLRRGHGPLRQLTLDGDRRSGQQVEFTAPPAGDPPATTTLNLATDDDEGRYRVIDVIQRRLDGAVIGGARVVVVRLGEADHNFVAPLALV